MSKKIYVKLRDAGTIFFDGVNTITGTLPVAIESKTNRIKDGIKSGLLLEVDEKEAEKAIAAAEEDTAKIASIQAASKSQKLALKAKDDEITDLRKALDSSRDGFISVDEHKEALKAKDDEAAEAAAAHKTELDTLKKVNKDLEKAAETAGKDLKAKTTAFDNLQTEYNKLTAANK